MRQDIKHEMLEYFKNIPDRTSQENRFLLHLQSEVDFFDITSVTRDDIYERGYDASCLSDEQMDIVAGAMAEAYCNNDFWFDLDDILDDMRIPKLQMKIKLYKVRIYQAYRADEEGVRWFTYKPNDTSDYKHEIVDEVEVELPDGISYNEALMSFDDKGHDCQLVTEKDGSASLVSSERIIKWIK